MNKQIAVIYSRVSTEEQGRGYSLPTQVESCRKYAIEKGYKVIAEFQDMHTGTELDRPGLNALYALVEKEPINVVLVHDIDRLSREVGNQAIIEMELGSAGVRIEYVIGQYANSPEGELMKLVKSGIAQYENRQRAERSRRGRIGKAKAGNIVCPSGRAPYGYTYHGEGHKSWFTINEREAEVVRLIYSMLVEDGQSSYAIARYLWEKQILTKGDYSDIVYKKSGHGEWSPSTIRRIISNPVYKGVWYYAKTRAEKVNGRKRQVPVPESEWIAVSVPAIISEDAWEFAQKCLEKNKQQATRNAKRYYLLRSLVFCPCGRRWVGLYKNRLKRAYYRCPTNEAEHWRHKCESRYSIRQEVLEHVVWDKISYIFLEPETLMQGLAEQRQASEELVERKNRRIEAVDRAIQEIDRKLGVLLDQVLTAEFAQAVIDEKRKVLMAQRAELESEMYRLSFELEHTVITTGAEEELMAFATQVKGSIKNADLETKRRILDLVQTRINVLGPKKIEICCLVQSGQIVDLSSVGN
jgi:site-specific DNA recombinase